MRARGVSWCAIPSHQRQVQAVAVLCPVHMHHRSPCPSCLGAMMRRHTHRRSRSFNADAYCILPGPTKSHVFFGRPSRRAWEGNQVDRSQQLSSMRLLGLSLCTALERDSTAAAVPRVKCTISPIPHPNPLTPSLSLRVCIASYGHHQDDHCHSHILPRPIGVWWSSLTLLDCLTVSLLLSFSLCPWVVCCLVAHRAADVGG